MIAITDEELAKYATDEFNAQLQAETPPGLSAQEYFRWRQNKLRQYIDAQKAKETAAELVQGDISEPEPDNMSEPESIRDGPAGDDFEPDMSDSDEPVIPDEDAPDNEEDNNIGQPELPPEEPETAKPPPEKKTSPRKKQSDAGKSEKTYIHDLPKSVMRAIRKHIQTDDGSKADAISAFVYIFTGGDCEISPSAMRMVENYKSDDKIVGLQEQVRIMAAAVREQAVTLQAIELCTCFETYDRRYGSEQRRAAPKDIKFRETGALDVLAALRRQAREQRAADLQERGRRIYNSKKDKNT